MYTNNWRFIIANMEHTPMTKEVSDWMDECKRIIDKKIIEDRAAAQKKYCEENGAPNFAGSGRCSCGRNVFEEKDGTSLVTYCQFCNKTFCD